MSGGGMGQALVDSGMRMGGQPPAQGGAQYSAPPASNPYQPAFSSQQSETGFGGLKPGAGPVNHMYQMPTMANDPLSQFGDKPPIDEMAARTAPYMPINNSAVGIGPPADFANQINQRPTVQQAPQVSPLVQQQMMQQRPMFNPMQQNSGLQAALMQMLGRQNQPMMRPQMRQMPQYRSPALGFRPNMMQAQQSLNRVQPSVYKTDLDAARARIAELEGQSGGYE